MDLPHDLRDALAVALSESRISAVALDVVALSARYRDEHTDLDLPFIGSESDAAAYAAFRMPATYAAVVAALSELQASAPNYRPESLLDVGAGPGTATWAATQVWPDLSEAILLERNEHMILLGKGLAQRANAHLVRDLVIASYLVGEIRPAERDAFVDRLWARAAGALVIIEPGTSRGFTNIRQARTRLIASGASIAAPCPHGSVCPMPEGDWCHFSQRVSRTPLQRGVKSGSLSYEDEKFSYVAAVRFPEHRQASRVLRHPQTRKGLVRLELCTAAGLERRTVSRRDGLLYKRARDVTWGSAIVADNN
jgi:ribosomal protein RSM22 (predicted rRNA methylase)